jgi:hypothetical protein
VSVIAAGDLDRIVMHGPASAWCLHCKEFGVSGVWPGTASARAREHSRRTGHTTEHRAVRA